MEDVSKKVLYNPMTHKYKLKIVRDLLSIHTQLLKNLPVVPYASTVDASRFKVKQGSCSELASLLTHTTFK